MANLTLSSISNKVALSAGGEKRVPALGDGTAKAGDAVGIIGATGKVVQCDVGASELFVGFLDIRYDIDMDTAITDGLPVEIIVPKSSHEYAVQIEDPAGTEYNGTPYGFSDTAGAMEAFAALSTAGVKGVLADTVNTGDLYGKLRWD